jgi:hypothetical protein
VKATRFSDLNVSPEVLRARILREQTREDTRRLQATIDALAAPPRYPVRLFDELRTRRHD